MGKYNTVMLIVDKVSFANKNEIETLNKHLRIFRDARRNTRFGGIHVLFTGDFFQLKPVGSKPLYLYTEFELWQRDVHTFMELKTNHRFIEDPEHGRFLDKYRSNMFQKKKMQKCTTKEL